MKHHTHVDTVNLLILVTFDGIENGRVPTEDETVREKTEKDRFREIHDCLSVNGETLAAEVEEETRNEVRLEADW
jgi:hypothetical protein